MGTVPSQHRVSVRWHGHGKWQRAPAHWDLLAHKPHRKATPVKGMCPQPAPVGLPGGSNTHEVLHTQCPGEWHRLKHVMSQGGHGPTDTAGALERQPKPLPSNLIPTSVEVLSILHGLCPKGEPPSSFRPPQPCCSPVAKNPSPWDSRRLQPS